VEEEKLYFEECLNCLHIQWKWMGSKIGFHFMVKTKNRHFSKYLLLCFTEQSPFKIQINV